MPTAATTAPVSSRIGAAMQHHAELALLVLDRAAALAHRRQRLEKLVRPGDGLAACAAQARPRSPRRHVWRLERQDRLALGGAVRGLAHAEIGAHADRLRAFEIVDVHDLGAVEDREMHALVDLLAQLVENGRASLDTSMRRRTSAPSRNSAMPSRYLPLSRVLLEHAFRDSVTASRCAVLLAIRAGAPASLMPMSTSSSENALSRRIAVATDDSRSRASDLARLAIA